MQIETSRLIIRSIEEKDFEEYGMLAKEHRLFRRFFVSSPSETMQSYWKMVTESGAEYYSIFRKGEELRFYGSLCIYPNEEQGCLQYEINLLNKYIGFKIGPEATLAFMEWLKSERKVSHLYLEITPDNASAKSMFKGIGAVKQKAVKDDISTLQTRVEMAAKKNIVVKILKYELDW